MENDLKFYVHYMDNDLVDTELGKFDNISDAKRAIKDYSKFRKSNFTKRGYPRANYKNQNERFYIADNYGGLWNIY